MEEKLFLWSILLVLVVFGPLCSHCKPQGGIFQTNLYLKISNASKVRQSSLELKIAWLEQFFGVWELFM